MNRILTGLVALFLGVQPAGGVDVPVHVNPALVFSPATGAFGAVSVGNPSSPLVITVANNGPTALAFSAALSGTDAADFSIDSNNCPGSLSSGASCQISVIFTPSISGDETALLTLSVGGGHTYPMTLLGGAATLSITLTPSLAKIPDNQLGGVILSTATVTWSDGAPFTGSLSISADAANLCQASGLTVVLKRTLSSADDGSFACTVTPIP